MSHWIPPEGVMVMEATNALLKDVQQGVLNDRFKALQPGRVLVSIRTGVDKFYLAWVDHGGVQSYKNVPARVWTLLFNRLRPVEDTTMIPVVLSRSTQDQLDSGELTIFKSVKKGTLREYKSQGTFPNSVGIVEDETGKMREAYILGSPKINSKGLLSIMTDRSIIFTSV